MKETCPHCGKSHDIPDSRIMSWAGEINGKRSKRKLTREQAEANRLKGLETRRKKAMEKYDYEITDSNGSEVLTGKCGGHGSDDAESLLRNVCDEVTDIQRDRQEPGGWLYSAETDKGNFDIFIH